ETLVFGDGMNGRSKFTVGAPFGQEMILAMASNDPILGPEVPATQSNTELLNALSNAFRGEAAVAEADRSVTARAKFLSVRGRGSDGTKYMGTWSGCRRTAAPAYRRAGDGALC